MELSDMPKFPVTCQECGKVFFVKERRKDTARFCSRACQAKFTSTIKICEECGKEFEIGKYRKDTARFCSQSCKGKWMSKNIIGEEHPNYGKPITEETRRKLIETHKGKKQSKETIEKRASQMRGKNHPAWKGGNIIKKCDECGNEFEIKRSHIGERNFCSRVCSGKWRSKHLIGENATRWAGGKIKKQCAQCGKDIEVAKSANLKLNYCSKPCYHVWMSENQVGVAHPLFGKPLTEGTRKKLSESHKGQHPSEETLKKRSISLKKVWIGAEERKKTLSEKLSGEKNPFWQGKGTVIKTCEICGKEFTVEKYRENTARVCSKECGFKLKEVEPIKIICKYCGKEFGRIPSQVKFFNPKYCSKECFALGSLSADRSDEYCDFFDSVKPRALAFYKDSYGDLCPLCGEYLISGVGSVHHVYGEKRSCCEMVGEKNYTNLNLKNHPRDFEIIGTPDKFIVLCKSCHSKIWPRKFEKRAEWTRHIEKMINEAQSGKSFYTMEEFYGDRANEEREKINRKILARQKKKKMSTSP
jgi:hypothetical protein